MGEWLATNILLPLMYLLIDAMMILGMLLFILATIDTIKEKIRRDNG
jgi:hypothetical protein|tara:strand:+ start:1922 stop:2062 length:141 start_codon:yes stop_codon:yes gene_type:complete